MAESLDITKLIDWLEGRLTEEEAKAVSAAIRAEESHQATVAWLRSFLSLSNSTVLIEPPAELLPAVTSHFREFAQGKRFAHWLQKLVATLTSDSRQRPSLVGVRRTGFDVLPRQLVYQTDTVDIMLNIRAESDRAVSHLLGQVFPKDESDPGSYTVQLTLRGQEIEVGLTYTDNVGKFTFLNLADGVYSLILRGDQVEITVADVELST